MQATKLSMQTQTSNTFFDATQAPSLLVQDLMQIFPERVANVIESSIASLSLLGQAMDICCPDVVHLREFSQRASICHLLGKRRVQGQKSIHVDRGPGGCCQFEPGVVTEHTVIKGRVM